MTSKNNNQLSEKIIKQALEFGANSADIARPTDLKTNGSYTQNARFKWYKMRRI